VYINAAVQLGKDQAACAEMHLRSLGTIDLSAHGLLLPVETSARAVNSQQKEKCWGPGCA